MEKEEQLSLQFKIAIRREIIRLLVERKCTHFKLCKMTKMNHEWVQTSVNKNPSNQVSILGIKPIKVFFMQRVQ